jgi:CheY-like chemotaxis protein
MSEGFETTRTSERAERDAQARRTRVLILDDHRASRDVCAGYCDLFDHVCVSVAGVAEALAALRRERFDAMVMGLGMAGRDTLSTLKAIRALPGPAGAVPIVGLAAVGRGDEAQRWLAAGLAAVVAKPVTAARLFAALGAATTAASGVSRSWARAD